MNRLDRVELVDTMLLEPGDIIDDGTAVRLAVFLLAIVALKNSRKRFTAASPTVAIIAGVACSR